VRKTWDGIVNVHFARSPNWAGVGTVAYHDSLPPGRIVAVRFLPRSTEAASPH
jgi:hypothetical protein